MVLGGIGSYLLFNIVQILNDGDHLFLFQRIDFLDKDMYCLWESDQ